MAKGVQNGKVSNLKNTIRFLVEFYVLAPKQKELLGQQLFTESEDQISEESEVSKVPLCVQILKCSCSTPTQSVIQQG